jgi:GTP-binding protein EngB required for normal cell division
VVISNSNADAILAWFDQHAKPFLAVHAEEKVRSLEADYDRLKKLLARPDQVTVCLLGNSGVGKSTLLNALAADEAQVLPAGGIGPLTAQATEVQYSEAPQFQVQYHPKGRLWQMTFALERRLVRQQGKLQAVTPNRPPQESDLAEGLSAEDVESAIQDEATGQPVAAGDPVTDAMEGLIKQAKNVVCGDQFADRTLEYLVDALRVACGKQVMWGSQVMDADAQRIARVRKILAAGKDGLAYERRMQGDRQEFMEDLKAHAAGFLSPLIQRIAVGWPSDVLRAGVRLVDLPGVGIAQDSYRDVTRSYVGDKARAVIVVVDRAGPTDSTIDLLRTSGYWDRLVGAADDPASDPCTMLIVVTKVDDVTNEERAARIERLQPGQPKPSKREVFLELVESFKPRMRAQIAEQLAKMGDTNNEAVREARRIARDGILSSLQIHPVSAPELRRLILDDEDDRPFLTDRDQTGIPGLRGSLVELSQNAREVRDGQIAELTRRLLDSAVSELEVIQASWQEDNRAAEEAERLQKALDAVVLPKKEEYRARAAEFRGFLKETVQARIEGLVLEARVEAEKDVRNYLDSLRGVHWGTLRAAVRRGGAFHGSRHVNLPDDISGYFQEPMAAVWGQKLLRDIRKRTTELANDIEQMVTELCDWARSEAGAQVNNKLLESQQTRIAALAEQMKAVGKEAVDEMRETVKVELATTIRKPIKKACEKFVQDGNDYGPGVKARILELFSQLAVASTEAAREPALRILTDKATTVRQEIQQEFKKGGDPLQETANLIVQRHEDRVRRADAQRRKAVLAGVEAALNACEDLRSADQKSRVG